jgi:ribonuclease HII
LSDLLICGVDEVGRGPLAGPVVAAAVILHPARPIEGLADSKKLSEKRRDFLDIEIRLNALAWCLGRAEVTEIDAINILQASLKAMQRAIAGLSVSPDLALVDGNRAPVAACQVRTIVGGDASEACISAASIIAKVARDREMVELDHRFPEYGFARHKGYPTKLHLQALRDHGVCPEHRRSFAPVSKIIGEISNIKG